MRPVPGREAMEFVVEKKALLKELQCVQGVVEKRTTVPILSNLLLETTGTNLAVTGTDLDVTIRCSCPAAIKVAGSLTVSARKLFDIVRLLPEAEIHFKMATGDSWVNVTCERSRFKIPSLSKENFPDVPSVDGPRHVLSAPAMRHMISRTIFAITQEESRFALNGALLILKPNKMTLVTTDGHRLALISRDADVAGVEGEMKSLIPKKTLVELVKLAASEHETIEFSKDSNHLLFQIGERILISRMLSGQFPNYEMVVPSENDQIGYVSSVELGDNLRRVAIMADEQSKAVKFDLSSGQLDISSHNADMGEAAGSMPVEFEGSSISICFNANYLLDFLSALDVEKVKMALKDGETQGLFGPGGEDEYSYQYVVMPMQL